MKAVREYGRFLSDLARESGLSALGARATESGGLALWAWSARGARAGFEEPGEEEDRPPLELELSFQEGRSLVRVGGWPLVLAGGRKLPSLTTKRAKAGELARPLRRFEEALAALLEANWRRLPEEELLRETRERLARLRELLEALAASGEGGGSFASSGPFGGLARGSFLALWNAEAYPFPGLLALLPEGGVYRGEVPGYPGTLLEAEVVVEEEEVRLVPRSLQVGSLSLESPDGHVELFQRGRLDPWGVLMAFPEMRRVREAAFLLREGKTEEASRLLALSRLAAA